VSRTAGFHSRDAARRFSDDTLKLAAPNGLAQLRLACSIVAVQLKSGLCQVDREHVKIPHGGPLH
jgi:hypothetical protein